MEDVIFNLGALIFTALGFYTQVSHLSAAIFSAVAMTGFMMVYLISKRKDIASI
jgi:hypothetical protein